MNTTAAHTNAIAATPSRRPGRGRVNSGVAATLVECAVLAVLAAAVVAAVLGTGTGTPEAVATISIQVAPGETLWEIAAEHAMPGLSTRELVEQIAKVNQLEGATVQTGQTLCVPTSPDLAVALASR